MPVCRLVLPWSVALLLGCAANSGPDPVDPNVGADDAALVSKFTPIAIGESPTISFDGTKKWYGFSFHGTAGQAVNIYAQAVFGKTVKGLVDPVVYLYKISK